MVLLASQTGFLKKQQFDNFTDILIIYKNFLCLFRVKDEASY